MSFFASCVVMEGKLVKFSDEKPVIVVETGKESKHTDKNSCILQKGRKLFRQMRLTRDVKRLIRMEMTQEGWECIG